MNRREFEEKTDTNENEHLSFRFTRVGDAFRYGMTAELPKVARNRGDGYANHLYASIAYLGLKEIVCLSKMESLPKMIYLHSTGESSVNSVVQIVADIVINELIKKYSFSDFDELKELLNNYEIPEWCFDYAEDIIKHYMNRIVLFEDDLYFIGESECDAELSLFRINVNRLGKGDLLIENNGIECLAFGFSKLLGFDKEHRRVYLDMYNQKDYFAYYEILNDEVVVCRNQFHSFVSGNLFVITQDNYLANVIGEKEHRINEYKKYEEYEERGNHFFVKPKSDGGRFFYPYYLFFDGRMVPAERSECERILWNYMTRQLVERTPFSMKYKSSAENAPLPRVFSIDGVKKALDIVIPKEKSCRNKQYVIIKNILAILEPYLDKNAENTRLFFALCEASSILNAEVGFPSETLYWRLKEIELENKESDLALAILLRDKNYEVLIREITNETETASEHEITGYDFNSDCESELAMECPWEMNAVHTQGKIGVFSFGAQGVIAHAVSFNEGMFLGAQIIPQMNLISETGLVTYDARTDVYYVTCDHDITSEEKMQLIKEFELQNKKTLIIKQGKALVEKIRTNQHYWHHEKRRMVGEVSIENMYDDDDDDDDEEV